MIRNKTIITFIAVVLFGATEGIRSSNWYAGTPGKNANLAMSRLEINAMTREALTLPPNVGVETPFTTENGTRGAIIKGVLMMAPSVLVHMELPSLGVKAINVP